MKPIAAVFAIALVAVGYFAWSEHGQLVALRAAAAKAGSDQKDRDSLARENRRLRDRIAELETQSVLATAPAPTQPAAGRGADRKATQDAIQSIASKMLNTPAMRTMITQRAREALEAQYAGFFDQLQLTPDQRSKLLDLMVERQSGNVDLAAKLMMGNLSSEERAAMAEQIRRDTQAANGRIREFLGDNGYGAMQAYTREQAEKAQVVELTAAFNQSGEPLTNDQSTMLGNIISEERRSFQFSQDPNDPAADPTGVMTGQASETYLREAEMLQNQIALRANTVLTPSQLETFRRTQRNQLQRSKSGIDLARQMLGQ